jgi:hypothetical protein
MRVGPVSYAHHINPYQQQVSNPYKVGMNVTWVPDDRVMTGKIVELFAKYAKVEAAGGVVWNVQLFNLTIAE